MQRFLSYVVEAPDEVFIEEHLLVLGPGTNVFSVTLADPDAFRQRLVDAGCTIRREYALDNHEAVPAVPEILAAREAARGLLPRGG